MQEIRQSKNACLANRRLDTLTKIPRQAILKENPLKNIIAII